MSLYDDIPPEKGKGAAAGAGGSWSSQGLKLLQSQIALKKAQATQAMRDRARAQNPAASAAAGGGESSRAAPPAVDLSTSAKLAHMLARGQQQPVDGQAATVGGQPQARPTLLKPRKPLVLDGVPPLNFVTVPREEQVVIFGEYTVLDEYSPLVPNDFAKLFAQYQAEKVQRKAKQIHEKEIRKRERETERDEEREAKKRTLGAAIAPPQRLVESDADGAAAAAAGGESGGGTSGYVPPTGVVGGAAAAPAQSSGGGGKGLAMAARLMQKYGYKEGGGLGSRNQGIAAPLHIERIGFGAGKITLPHGNGAAAAQQQQHEAGYREAERDAAGFAVPPPAPPPAAATGSNAQLLANPSKVVLLRNMVGRGEVDSELEPETREEMLKYGAVHACTVYEMPLSSADDDAVRIFVEFAKADQAMKAVIDLNGRWFGGRQVRATFYDVDKFARSVLTHDM